MVFRLKITTSNEQDALVAKMLVMMVSDNFDLKNHRAFHIASAALMCLGQAWSVTIPTGRQPESGPLGPHWHMNHSDFGPTFATAIRLRNGTAMCNFKEQRTALAYFCVEFCSRFYALLHILRPRFDGTFGNDYDFAPVIADLRLFEFVTPYATPNLSFPLVAQWLTTLHPGLDAMRKVNPADESTQEYIFHITENTLHIGAAMLLMLTPDAAQGPTHETKGQP